MPWEDVYLECVFVMAIIRERERKNRKMMKTSGFLKRQQQWEKCLEI